MGTRYQMTWKADSRRWRKRYKGKDHYFRVRVEESKPASYARCYALWCEKKTMLDLEATESRSRPHLDMWQIMLDVEKAVRQDAREADDHETWRYADRKVRELEARVAGQYSHPSLAPGNGPDLPDTWGDVLPAPTPPWEAAEEAEPSEPVNGSIGVQVAEFTAQKLAQAKNGNLTLARYDAIARYLQHFATWMGPGKPANGINGKTLIGYHAEIRGRIKVGNLSEYGGRDYFAVAKQFIKNLWQSNVLSEMPRNMESREFRFDTSAKEIQVFSVDEIKRLLDTATDRTRLYVLLMLNCGYGPQDISDLRHDQVDWKVGRIKRKRSKTSDHVNVPTVDYPLWPETFKLLTAFRSDHPEHAVISRGSRTLCNSAVSKTGKVTRINLVKDAWRVLEKKVGTGKPLKALRKTGASLLANEYDESLAELFLGHSPKTVATKHYIRPDGERFDTAIRWLGAEFGVE